MSNRLWDAVYAVLCTLVMLWVWHMSSEPSVEVGTFSLLLFWSGFCGFWFFLRRATVRR
jgi:hypothetical protein